MCDTGWVSTYYSVHQHGEGELMQKEMKSSKVQTLGELRMCGTTN